MSLAPNHLTLNPLDVYQRGVACVQEAMRDCLAAHGGYECKEPEAGKFTLAFW